MAARRMERALSEANGCLSFGRIYCWNFQSRGLFASGGKSAPEFAASERRTPHMGSARSDAR